MRDKITFNTFVKEVKNVGDGMDTTRSRMNKKSHKRRNYGHAPGEPGSGSGVSPSSASGGMSEHYDSIIKDIFKVAEIFETNSFDDFGYEDEEEEEYEEDAEEVEAQQQAAAIFRALYNRQDLSREDIINQIENRTGVTNSTAVSYYQRLAKQAGPRPEGNDMGGGMGSGVEDPEQMSNNNDEMMDDDDDDLAGSEDQEPLIRTIDGAHLVRKDQDEDGRFEEVWVYNVGKEMKDALKIRREILAGTDIGEKKTQSDDGEQSYTLWTLGNAQILHITGLPN